MNELTLEWVTKAEGDFATARRENRVRKQPNYDAVCFHAQQCAEKYLKAYLQESGSPVPRTHSLAQLVGLVPSTFEAWRDSLDRLDRYAVEFRYPGDLADRSDARNAFMTVKLFRTFARAVLGVDAPDP
ncbi:MAG: HEPN domain-containing protein [Ardenticatenia bacterium]|nr:HEPN domain-containing protein [Ardenticatenia bacterium]